MNASLSKVIAAIERQEGFDKPTSRARRNNNPGNLKMGPRARRFGAESMDDGHHAIFPSEAAGRAALVDLLEVKFRGFTLRQIGKVYAEDPRWAEAISKMSGIALDAIPDPLPNMPMWYQLALNERGVLEAGGTRDNPVVQAYYRDAGFPEVKHDSVPWCAAFVGAMLFRSGKKPSGSLLARSYERFGLRLNTPKQGCIIVMKRGTSTWTGHVAFYVRPGYMLGGNQSDMVSIARYNPSMVTAYRWP